MNGETNARGTNEDLGHGQSKVDAKKTMQPIPAKGMHAGQHSDRGSVPSGACQGQGR